MFVLLSNVRDAEAQVARSNAIFAYGPIEETLGGNIMGTVLQPGGLQWPGTLTAEQLAEDMALQFAPLSVPPEVVHAFAEKLPPMAVLKLQRYWVWTQMQSLQPGAQGPEWSLQRYHHRNSSNRSRDKK